MSDRTAENTAFLHRFQTSLGSNHSHSRPGSSVAALRPSSGLICTDGPPEPLPAVMSDLELGHRIHELLRVTRKCKTWITIDSLTDPDAVPNRPPLLPLRSPTRISHRLALLGSVS